MSLGDKLKNRRPSITGQEYHVRWY